MNTTDLIYYNVQCLWWQLTCMVTFLLADIFAEMPLVVTVLWEFVVMTLEFEIEGSFILSMVSERAIPKLVVLGFLYKIK